MTNKYVKGLYSCDEVSEPSESFLDKEIKDKWIKALRSGEYEQTMNRLVSPVLTHSPLFEDTLKGFRYCCLGVLCKVMDKKEVKCSRNSPVEQRSSTDYLRNYYFETELDSDGMLSKKTLMEVGLTELDASALAERNDQGDSFEEIADIIDQFATGKKDDVK